MRGDIKMNIGQKPTTGSFAESSQADRQSEVYRLERFAAAYVQFDAQMTTQLEELELDFQDFWTPQAKKMELLGRR